MDHDFETPDNPFNSHSTIVDRIVNWGVCSIAVIAVIAVGILVARQQMNAPTAPAPIPNVSSTRPATEASPFVAPTMERPAADAAATQPAPAQRTAPKAVKPKQVDVPVVVEVREHRSEPKKSAEDDGR
jgi:hypothetical protein